MKRFSPMFAGGAICTVALVGYAAVMQSELNNTEPPHLPPAREVSLEKPLPVRDFLNEGSEGALRISFRDLDLLQLAGLQAVTPDCTEKMPDSLKTLDGKVVRLRGFMKPANRSSGLPGFLLVRSTDMCCMGPMGRVDHLAGVTLKEGTTTDYIEQRPFDVEGRFRIHVSTFEESGAIEVSNLYYLDDATIILR